MLSRCRSEGLRWEHMFAKQHVTSSGAGSSLLEPLNDEQVAAVTHRGGPLLVLAGAGTGKTTTLSARVGWLVDQGLRRSGFCC